MDTVAQRIRLLRNKLGLNQTEFAKKLGRKQQTIANWETGARNLPDFSYLALTQVFNVNETWLRTGKGEMFASQSANPSTKRELVEQKLLEKFRELPIELQDQVVSFCDAVLGALNTKSQEDSSGT